MSNTDPKASNFAGPCPRCAGPVPNAATPGEYPGALSRYDNETYICSGCGSSEAMMAGHLIPLDVALFSDEAKTIRDAGVKA